MIWRVYDTAISGRQVVAGVWVRVWCYWHGAHDRITYVYLWHCYENLSLGFLAMDTKEYVPMTS